MKSKRTTLATIKSFMKRELKCKNLYVKQLSTFDGMIDMVDDVDDEFTKVELEELNLENRNDLGIRGVWFVNDSRDGFEDYSDDDYIGYKVYNCCGSFIVAFKRIK